MKQKLKMLGLAFVLCISFILSPELQAIDRDNNPPGPAGGPGTNWENPPGLKGGIGTSPNRHHRYRHRRHYCKHHDCDNNPPGPAGGPGTNWENPPGPAGGPGSSPNIK